MKNKVSAVIDVRFDFEDLEDVERKIEDLFKARAVMFRKMFGNEPVDGFYDKYSVYNNWTGERKDAVMVMYPFKDKSAIDAIKAYEKSTNNLFLKRDIVEWMKEFEEHACGNKNRENCKIAQSPVCCAHCELYEECFPHSPISLCPIVVDGTVSDIGECPFRKEGN